MNHFTLYIIILFWRFLKDCKGFCDVFYIVHHYIYNDAHFIFVMHFLKIYHILQGIKSRMLLCVVLQLITIK